MGRPAYVAALVGAAGLTVMSVALAAPGHLDPSFGTAGKVKTDLGGADWAGSIAVAPDGGVLVAGGSGADVATVRYDALGRLDPDFGSRGAVVTDLGGADAAGGILVQPDGKIAVAAQRDGDLVLIRYSPGGALDPSFGGDGVVVRQLGFPVHALAVLRQPGGRLVVAGSGPGRLVLARYLSDGRPDTAFGRKSVAVVRKPGVDWRILVQAPDGKLVAAGARVVTEPAQAMALAVARYGPDGRLDRTFSKDGVTVTRPRNHWAGAVELGVRPDGRIVLGTHGHAAGRAGFALVQFRRNGSLDRAFGDRGVTVSEVGFGVHALGLDRRGRIVTVGRTKSLLDFVVARFLPDGRRDPSFAPTVADFGGVDVPFALTIQRDGKFLAAGASAAPGTGIAGEIAVARYLASP